MTVLQTSDATRAYRERSAANIARVESTAQDGTIASFSRDNTLIVSSTTFYPLCTSLDVVYVPVVEEQAELQFVSRCMADSSQKSDPNGMAMPSALVGNPADVRR